MTGRCAEREAEGLGPDGLVADGDDRGRLPGVRHASVALVALLEPGVAAVVVAVAFPEPGFVVIEEPEPADPLGALPEVEMRYEETRRSAVIARQRLAV